MITKSLQGFHILVELQGGSLAIKNELTHRHFVGFGPGFMKYPCNILTASVDFK